MIGIPRYVSWLALAPLLAATALAQSVPDELDRLRDDLAQPGPEGRSRRELAIERLLGRAEVRAHEILVQALQRGDDADRTSRTIHRELAKKLANPADPAFGQAAGKGRTALLRLYGRTWLQHAAGAEAEQLAALARECLIVLRPLERFEIVQELLLAEPDASKGFVLTGASECRDLGLAPLVAEYLEHAQHGVVAARALQRLLFAPRLATRADFERWQREHDGTTYIDLAERAARRGLAASDDLQLQSLQRLLAARLELLDLLLAAVPTDWAQVRKWALEVEPNELRAPCLTRVKERMLARERELLPSPVRLDLVAELQRRLEAESDPLHQALLIETSALLVHPPDGEVWQKVLVRTLVALEHKEPAVRVGALAALARHPTLEVQERVLRALRLALDASSAEVAAAALQALASKGWRAPAAAAAQAEWLAQIERAIDAPFLEVKARLPALQVVSQRDPAQASARGALALLLRIAGDASRDPLLREQALVRAATCLETAATARAFTQDLVRLLADAEPRLRAQASSLLGKVPAEAFGGRELDALADRIAAEAEEPVLRMLFETLKLRANEAKDPTPVVRALQRAASQISARTGSSEVEDARRALLASSLTTLAGTQGIAPEAWMLAVEALLLLRDRDGALHVLGRQRPFVGTAELAPELRPRAARIVIATALLKPRTIPWRQIPDEARMVLQAGAALEARTETQESLALRIAVLAELDRPKEALELLQRPASRPTLGGEDGARLRASVAESCLRGGDAAAALVLLDPLVQEIPLTSNLGKELLLLRVEAAFAADPNRKEPCLEQLRQHAETFRAAPDELRRRYADLEKKIAQAPG